MVPRNTTKELSDHMSYVSLVGTYDLEGPRGWCGLGAITKVVDD